MTGSDNSDHLPKRYSINFMNISHSQNLLTFSQNFSELINFSYNLAIFSQNLEIFRQNLSGNPGCNILKCACTA